MNLSMKLSLWAKENKRMARIGIITGFLLINLLAVITGNLIADMGMALSKWVFYGSVITFSCIFFLYPYRESRKGGNTWRSLFLRRKIFDFLAAFTGYLIMLQSANHYSIHPEIPVSSFGSTVAMGSLPHRSGDISKDNTKPFYRNYSHWLKSKWESFGRKKNQLKLGIALLKKKDDNNSSKALLTILTILGAIGLLFLVILLSCEISCSGAETLGLIVLIGGGFMVVFAAILIILRIYGKRIRKRKKTDAVSFASK
jgi:hypothetical protein